MTEEFHCGITSRQISPSNFRNISPGYGKFLRICLVFKAILSIHTKNTEATTLSSQSLTAEVFPQMYIQRKKAPPKSSKSFKRIVCLGLVVTNSSL